MLCRPKDNDPGAAQTLHCDETHRWFIGKVIQGVKTIFTALDPVCIDDVRGTIC